MKYKVLCYYHDDKGRDIEILAYLKLYLKNFENCEFKNVHLRNLLPLFTFKPDVVLIANTVGSKLHYQISSLSKKLNIPIFSLISEGNYRTDGTYNYWGWNTKKKFNEEFICFWSERTMKFMTKELAGHSNKLALVGGTGFDKYAVNQINYRDKILAKINKQHYKKVVGYAGWAFGKCFQPKSVEIWKQFYGNEQADKMLQWRKKQRVEVKNALEFVIQKHPDTLFILRKHPSEDVFVGSKLVKNEMSELTKYENVVYQIDQEFSIAEIIRICDLWMGFETTTCLEGWLCGKETILINPFDIWLSPPSRANIHKGNVITKTAKGLNQLIETFFKGNFDALVSDEKIAIRKSLIKETIGYSDGLNHLRAAQVFKRVLAKNKSAQFKLKNFGLLFSSFLNSLLYGTLKIFYIRSLFLLLPKFKKLIRTLDTYDMKTIEAYENKQEESLIRFYKNKNIKQFLVKGELNEAFDFLGKEKVKINQLSK